MVRIDHFRGFAGYWEIPASCPTATRRPLAARGPGKALFDAIARALGPLPIVAEDLGFITPDVIALRDGFGFPGMRILQFAFGGDAATTSSCRTTTRADTVVYTGTHDNDTARGWWDNASARERALRRQLPGRRRRRRPLGDDPRLPATRWPTSRSSRCRTCSAWTARTA